MFLNKNQSFVQNKTTFSIGIFTNREDYEKNTPNLKCLVDLEFLKKNNEPEELLDYVMYLDGFFNNNWILNLCSFPNIESSKLLSDLLEIKTKKHYETGIQFECKNKMTLMSFKVFQEILKNNLETRVENLLTYFFSDYSKNNFNITWIVPTFANSSEKLDIQAKNLFTVEEQIRKQWKLLVEEHEVDSDLFRLENTPSIKSLKSMLGKKYVYINKEKQDQDIEYVLFLLFSDQSTLGYLDEEINEDTFARLIFSNPNVNISDFESYQKSKIQYLKDKEIISITESGKVYLTDKQKLRIMILKELYNYGVINYYHCLDSFEKKIYPKNVLNQLQQEINKMIEDKLVITESTLFSRPETDYLNYVLNDSSFNNSLGLRNKHLHGSILDDDDSEEYLYILVILMIYVVKINEELCLSNQCEETSISINN